MRSSDDRYVFTGRIHPERYNWHIEPDFSMMFELDGEMIELRLCIHRSQLSANMVGLHAGPLVELKNTVESIARMTVDALGFVAAAGLEVEVVSCVDPVGELHVFNTGFDGLREVDGDLTVDEVGMFRDLAIAAGGNFGLQAALADFRQAILAPGDTLFYCYRAIEAIRQEWLPIGGPDEGATRAASWIAVREISGAAETDLRWLADAATPRRHGVLTVVTAEERTRGLQLARLVVGAHLRHQLGDSGEPASPLDVDE